MDSEALTWILAEVCFLLLLGNGLQWLLGRRYKEELVGEHTEHLRAEQLLEQERAKAPPEPEDEKVVAARWLGTRADDLAKEMEEMPDGVDKQLRHVRYLLLKGEQLSLSPEGEGVAENTAALLEHIHRLTAQLDLQADQQKEAESDERVKELNARLEFFKQRVESLDAFRDMYMDANRQLEELAQEHAALRAQMEALVAEEHKHEFNRLLDRYLHVGTPQVELPHELTPEAPAPERPERTLDVGAARSTLGKANAQTQMILSKMLKQFNAWKQDPTAVMKNLEDREKEVRYMESLVKNSRVSLKILEDALQEANHKVNILQEENRKLSAKSHDLLYMQDQLGNFAKDAAQMMDCIQMLEKENRELRLKSARVEAVQGVDHAQQEELVKVRSELLSLQNEYTTLEGQYLALCKVTRAQAHSK